MRRLLLALFCVGGVIVVINASRGAERLTPNVQKLVDESTKKKAIEESRLLVANPLLDSDVREALAYIRSHVDYSSYHLLLALRKYYPGVYKKISSEEKSAILCSALNNTICLNDWGVLKARDSFDDQSAKALLETGKVALKYLAPMLDNDSPALLSGSQEAFTSEVYGYRRKDFAYRYASLILGKSPVFRDDPKQRDKDIEALKAELKKPAGGVTPKRTR